MKTPAQGPYEIAIVQDEEGKARGSNGEQWIMIRNETGAIATVYPGKEAEATAWLLAGSWKMLESLKETREAVAFLIGVIEKMAAVHPQLDPDDYLPDGLVFEGFGMRADAAIAAAEGREYTYTPPGRPEPPTTEPHKPEKAKQS